jgi:hypothetical protein
MLSIPWGRGSELPQPRPQVSRDVSRDEVKIHYLVIYTNLIKVGEYSAVRVIFIRGSLRRRVNQ